jgi:hypothetical protein
VRKWIREGRGVLFLPYQANEIASLRHIISTWMRLAVFETMSGPDSDRRIWFVVDELDALGAIDGQVRGTYGDTEAQTRPFGFLPAIQHGSRHPVSVPHVGREDARGGADTAGT